MSPSELIEQLLTTCEDAGLSEQESASAFALALLCLVPDGQAAGRLVVDLSEQVAREQAVLEVCPCDEFIASVNDIDRDEEPEKCGELFCAVFEALENAGYQVCPAKGQRAYYHGFNGAQYKRQWNIVGTYDKLTDAEWNRVCDVIYEAIY